MSEWLRRVGQCRKARAGASGPAARSLPRMAILMEAPGVFAVLSFEPPVAAGDAAMNHGSLAAGRAAPAWFGRRLIGPVEAPLRAPPRPGDRDG